MITLLLWSLWVTEKQGRERIQHTGCSSAYEAEGVGKLFYVCVWGGGGGMLKGKVRELGVRSCLSDTLTS